MKKILVVIDMQNDFIGGSLGTKEAQAIVQNVKEKIAKYAEPNCAVFATRDTHTENYMQTQEGQNLPVEHCIKGTHGWQINSTIAAELEKANATIIDKPTFGSMELQQTISELSSIEQIKIELVGLCTDICVVSNALLLKARMPEVFISVDPSCCAGVTPAKHEAALETMRSCQISIS